MSKYDFVYDFMASVENPFTLEDVLALYSPTKGKISKKEISAIISDSGNFVYKKSLFYPKQFFLSKIPFRIKPTKLELEQNVLILGHRILPFKPINVEYEEIKLLYHNKPLPQFEKEFLFDDIMQFFVYMNLFEIPIKELSTLPPPTEKNRKKQKATLLVYNMKEFYEENKFQEGETIIVTAKDFKTGIFDLQRDPMANYEKNITTIEQLNEKFLDSLAKSLSINMKAPTTEKQLLYTYFFMKDSIHTIPPSPIGPLISTCDDFKIDTFISGQKIFLFFDESVEDKIPELDSFVNKVEDQKNSDLDSIEGILQYIGNGYTGIEVRALIYDQIAFGNFDYQKIYDFLFHGMPKPFGEVEELEVIFKELVEEEFQKIKEIFVNNPPPLDFNIIRKKILENLKLSVEFIRSLDNDKIAFKQLPKKEIHNLSDINQSFLQMLNMLEATEDYDPREIKHIEELSGIVDQLNQNLPQIFNDIKKKIKK